MSCAWRGRLGTSWAYVGRKIWRYSPVDTRSTLPSESPINSSAASAAPRTLTRFPFRIVRRYCRPLRSMKRIVSPSRRSAAFTLSVLGSAACMLDSGMRHRLRPPAPDLGDQTAVAAERAGRGHAAAFALAELGGFGHVREDGLR